jgi:hypothetical protein
LISDAAIALCKVVPTKQAEATTFYNKLKAAVNAFPNAKKYLSNTYAYINGPMEESAFLAGGITCDEFFIGLRAAFTADLKADISLSPLEKMMLQSIDKLITVV